MSHMYALNKLYSYMINIYYKCKPILKQILTSIVQSADMGGQVSCQCSIISWKQQASDVIRSFNARQTTFFYKIYRQQVMFILYFYSNVILRFVMDIILNISVILFLLNKNMIQIFHSFIPLYFEKNIINC